MSEKVVCNTQDGAIDERRHWIEPEVVLMTANDSSAGANPANPEGLAYGS